MNVQAEVRTVGEEAAAAEGKGRASGAAGAGGQVAVVEVQRRVDGVADAGRVLVRDTTNRESGTLAFTADVWARFLTTLRLLDRRCLARRFTYRRRC